MGVAVAEYLGRRVDAGETIHPIDHSQAYPCPFMSGGNCIKTAKKKNPVCSVRRHDGELWIVCENRLCPTKKDLPLGAHQVGILTNIARHIFKPNISPSEIGVKREEKIKIYSRGGDGERGSYKADYVISTKSGLSGTSGPDILVLEMQGGGETSGTEKMTKVVKEWEADPNRSNEALSRESAASPLPANAWRRQQEQFLIKGDVAMKSWKGLGIAFCVGTILFDYIIDKVRPETLPDLKDYNWTLCLMGIKEDTSKPIEPGPIPLTVDEDRLIYTNYQTFVQALINRGEPTLSAFRGEFLGLDNETFLINF